MRGAAQSTGFAHRVAAHRLAAAAERSLRLAAFRFAPLAKFYGACLETIFWLGLGVGVAWMIISAAILALA